MRDRFYRFMAGRYGMDQLSRFLSYAALALIVINFIVKNSILWYAAVILIVIQYYRTFSRQIEKRRRENAWYLRKTYAITNGFKNWRERQRQRKDYVFFRCSACKSMLRVPRGKGKIRVTCRKCGNVFERRT